MKNEAKKKSRFTLSRVGWEFIQPLR